MPPLNSSSEEWYKARVKELEKALKVSPGPKLQPLDLSPLVEELECKNTALVRENAALERENADLIAQSKERSAAISELEAKLAVEKREEDL